MSEPLPQLDGDTLKFGLLMESAQAHQKSAESHLDRLRAHTLELDGVVREEIRRTLIDELQLLTTEAKRATQSLQAMKRAAHLHGVLWSTAAALLCTAIPTAVVRYLLPSSADVAVLQARRDALTLSIRQLELGGGRTEWRRCGESKRLCIRVDRKAPVYGDSADYYIVKGY